MKKVGKSNSTEIESRSMLHVAGQRKRYFEGLMFWVIDVLFWQPTTLIIDNCHMLGVHGQVFCCCLWAQCGQKLLWLSILSYPIPILFYSNSILILFYFYSISILFYSNSIQFNSILFIYLHWAPPRHTNSQKMPYQSHFAITEGSHFLSFNLAIRYVWLTVCTSIIYIYIIYPGI